jgi:hypothetical protein
LPPQNDGRDIDELRRSVDALGELLRQERIRTEALRARLNQQEAQIRELQRSTRSILDSRIWKTLVRLGGQGPVVPTATELVPNTPSDGPVEVDRR